MAKPQRQKLSDEERTARHAAGMKRYFRRVDRQIDDLFAWFDARDESYSSPDAADFIATYRRTYGEGFPFIYARAHTEFGERYGDLSAEDCAWGQYAPSDAEDEQNRIAEQFRMAEEVDTPEDWVPESVSSPESNPEQSPNPDDPNDYLIPK